MSQAELTHTLGANVDQKLLIRDHLSCYLEELSRHMAQESNGMGCFRRELKNDRHAACEGGWSKLRGEHGKKRVLTFQAKPLLVNEFVKCQRTVLPDRRISRARRRILSNRTQHDSFELPLADPAAPPVISKRDEPSSGYKFVDLIPNWRCFGGSEIIVKHKPAILGQQVAIAIQVPAHVVVRIKNKQADFATAKHLPDG